jgi:branched-chain amino acid transport system substrate-binding protein
MNQLIKNRRLFYSGVMLAVSLSLMTTWEGCGSKKPIKIGFAGCLTGRLSDLGVAGRDAVTLAVEQLNQTGGIHGRPVELYVKDDQQDPNVAIKVDQELISEGVVAIIGHMTSTMTMAVLPLINEKQMVMISPTSSANDLTGLDDYFFRITPANKTEIDHLIGYLVNVLGLKKVTCVYDHLANRSFSEGWYRDFTTTFEPLGGQVSFTATFTSGQEVSYLNLAKEVAAAIADGVIIIAGSLDAAMLCQQLKKLGVTLPIISSGWAKTPDFLKQGGASVEGVIFSQTFNNESQDPNYTHFKELFTKYFEREPDFAAAFSYEAAQLLFTALSKTENVKNLKATILKQRVFNGLQGELSIDQYGDSTHQRFLLTVKNGQFVPME